jgi:hypothetical protein
VVPVSLKGQRPNAGSEKKLPQRGDDVENKTQRRKDAKAQRDRSQALDPCTPKPHLSKGLRCSINSAPKALTLRLRDFALRFLALIDFFLGPQS